MSERDAFVTELIVARFALALADIMEAQGVSQRQLARRIGVSEARVSQILAADGNPTIKTIARIADALGRRVLLELIPRAEPMPRMLTKPHGRRAK